MNIELTDEQQAALEKDGSLTITMPKKVEKWEPEVGSVVVSFSGKVLYSTPDALYHEAGRVRKTRELADRAAAAARQRDRLEAFRDQYWPDWIADWSDENQAKYFVFHDANRSMFLITTGYACHYVGVVYGPKEFAEKASRMLNSGELVL